MFYVCALLCCLCAVLCDVGGDEGKGLALRGTGQALPIGQARAGQAFVKTFLICMI